MLFLFLCVTLTKNGFITWLMNCSFVFVVSNENELSISIISTSAIKQANSNKFFLPVHSFPNNIIFKCLVFFIILFSSSFLS